MGLLDGKVVLVTGAGNGIGRAHALALAAAGARVVVNDLGGARDGQGASAGPAQAVVDEIRARGGEAVPSADSVTDPEGPARMVALATSTWGRLDAVINNAGILRDRTFAKLSEADWRLVVDVHLHGSAAVIRAALPALSVRGGTIVNTSSVSGLVGNFGQSNYAAAKAGIYALTRVLALELARAGITVNALAPVAKTRMTEDIDRVDAAWTPEHVASVAVWLCSDLARGVTGKVLGVSGPRLYAYEMRVGQGVTKPDGGVWAPEEISARLDDILQVDAPRGPRWPVGKVYDGGNMVAWPDHAREYAAATGDTSPAYAGDDAICPPMFHVRLFKPLLFAVATDPALGLDMLRLVHGEHDATFHRPIRPGERVRLSARLESVEEKSTGLLVVSRLHAHVGEELAVEARTAYFIRAAEPPSAPRQPAEKAPPPEPPPPTFAVPLPIAADQSVRYAQASLDDNPIHLDPEVAARAGLPGVILQGLCTMAMTGAAVVREAAGGDARRLRRLAVRFARPVLNGTTLEVRGWDAGGGRWTVETRDATGRPVLTGAFAEIAP